jgi:hypothetical protein
VATGRFDYDRRGILDRTHLRFFTGRSFARLAEEAGFRILRREAIGVPLEVTGRGGGPDDVVGRHRGRFRMLLDSINRWTVAAWPSLFAYQYVYELAPKRNI